MTVQNPVFLTQLSRTVAASEKPSMHHTVNTVTKEPVSFKDMIQDSETPNLSVSKKLEEPANQMKVNLDMNNDGVVNMHDLNMQLANSGGKDMSYDHNRDGSVDSKDLDILLSFWGTEGDMIVSSPDLDNDGIVNMNDLNQMLANFGSEDQTYDLNNDGVNDQRDLDVLLAFWGQSNLT